MKVRWGDVPGALMLAAVTGPAVLTLELGFFGLWRGEDQALALSDVMFGITLVMFVATPVFGAGILAVGTPVWALLHRSRWNRRATATLAGAVLAGLAMQGIVLWDGAPPPFEEFWPVAMLAPGAAAGWVLHRIAYGRSTGAEP